MSDPPPFLPTSDPALWQLRARLLADVRRFFDTRGFLEVQTPVLGRETVADRHLEPIAVPWSGSPTGAWLQTSPERCMKRMLAAGADAIYQIGPAFRAGESGPRHNPEFTMLEWYRAGDSYAEGMSLLAEFTGKILDTPPPQILTYREAFRRAADLDPFETPDEQLRQRAAVHGTAGGDRDELLNVLLACEVQPTLGLTFPEIVCDWPASQAALAVVRHDGVPVAERFELYVRGVELANGYHELTDADELRRRWEQVNRGRQADGKPPLPLAESLWQAMRHGLPPSCGVAAGFDRLLMIAAGCDSIRQVLSFPIDRA